MSDEVVEEKKMLSIGVVSKKTGLPVSTIRFYEKEFGGYLRLPKTAGGHRRFRPQDVEKLKRIHRLTHEQYLPLKKVKETLVSELDPLFMRKELDLVLETFEALVKENVKLNQAVDNLAARISGLEEDRKKKRFKLF